MAACMGSMSYLVRITFSLRFLDLKYQGLFREPFGSNYTILIFDFVLLPLPLCNLYLQDRRSAGTAFPRSPLWRGLTLIHDLLDAGIPVACASDNVRDAFHAFGDYDLADVYVQSIRLAHLDARLADSVRVVTSTAADLIGSPEYGRIAPGSPAHLVVFDAHRFSELLSRPGAPRRCIDGEEIHRPAAPDFAELADRSE